VIGGGKMGVLTIVDGEGISKRALRFMISMFGVGIILGLIASFCYSAYLMSVGGWDKSTSLFHAVVLLFGLGVTVPALSTSLRMLYHGLVLSERGLQNAEKLSNAVDRAEEKAGPMVDRFERMVGRFERLLDIAESERAKAMLARVEKALESGLLENLADEFEPRGTPPSIRAALPTLVARGNGGVKSLPRKEE